MKFKYQAKTKEGESQVGFVEASDRDSAVSILANHDLFVLSVEQQDSPGPFDRVSTFFARPRQKDMVIFSRQLATLLDAHLPLADALKLLYAQTQNKLLKEAIYEVTEDVDAGISFSQALARQGNTFPEYYVEMIRAAEITGNLNELTSFLADYTEKEAALISKTTSALIYPGIVVGLFIVVGFILITFVYPSLGTVFAANNVSLPWYTQILLGIGLFMAKWWFAVLALAIVLALVVIDYFETDEGKALFHEAELRLPVVKNVFTPVIMARFGNSAALLVHGGIPIAQSLEIISHMLGNTLYRDIMHEVAGDVRQGKLLSESLAAHPDFFPVLIPQMVAVGETTGKIEDMFDRLSGIYTKEADRMTNNLVDLIQPMLMIAIGLMVGLLFASVLIPIYNLTASIH